jgi:hypothetical protein
MSLRTLIIILTLYGTSLTMGQSELGSYFLDNTSASQYLNPANNPDATFSWGLPNLYYVSGSEGPGIYGLIKDNIFNLNSLKGELKDNNSTLYAIQGSLGALHFSYDIYSFHIGHQLKSYWQADYNNLLFDMLLNGNAPYIGETVNIGPYVNMNFYNEFYLGFGIELQNLNLGARVKRYNGYSNLYTPKHLFSIYTNDEIYQLEFNTEYRVHTNLISDSLSFANYFDQLSGNLTGNGGWGLDFGMKADILDQFTLSASILDMGVINWKNGASQIVTEGNYSFEGFDLAELITDSLDVIQLDSLASIINVSKNNESYKAGLPVQFYLGLQYYPVEEWEVNALFYTIYSSGRSHPALRLGGTYKPSEYFQTSLAYTWNRFAYFNLGWSGQLNLDWFHLYLAMDNVIDVFRPVGGNYFNVRAGVQIDFVK